MARSRIEIYWKQMDTAPVGVGVQLRVTDGSGSDYLLPYPCKLVDGVWINAVSGSPLAVRPAWWKLYVKTTRRKQIARRSQQRPPSEKPDNRSGKAE